MKFMEKRLIQSRIRAHLWIVEKKIFKEKFVGKAKVITFGFVESFQQPNRMRVCISKEKEKSSIIMLFKRLNTIIN